MGCDIEAIANQIMATTDIDSFFKAFVTTSESQSRESDGGGQMATSFELPRDGSAEEADLMTGWDPGQSSFESPSKITHVVIDEIEEGELSNSLTAFPKKTDDVLPAKVVEVRNASASSSSSSSSSLMSSVADAVTRPTKPTNPNQSNSARVAPSSSTSSTSLVSTSKSYIAAKPKSNRNGSSIESMVAPSSASTSTAVPIAETAQSGKTKDKKDKKKSIPLESAHRRSAAAADSKKNDKERTQNKEKKDKEKEREDAKKKKDRPPENSQPVGKNSSDLTKRPFGFTHVVTKRLYPAHQCAAPSSIFANSDLFESESPTRKRPKHHAEVLQSAAAQQRPLSKVEAARRKLTDSMPDWRSESPPPASTSAARAKDRSGDERRPSALSAEKRRDIYSPEVESASLGLIVILRVLGNYSFPSCVESTAHLCQRNDFSHYNLSK